MSNSCSLLGHRNVANEIENLKKNAIPSFLKNLEEGSLAKDIIQVQKDKQFTGIYHDCQLFLNELEISDVKIFSKYQWKKS